MANLDPDIYKNGELIKPVTTDANGKPTLAPQPKVIAGAIAGIALTVAVGAIDAITPDLFGALGPWAPVAYAGVVALGSSLAAYIKRPSSIN